MFTACVVFNSFTKMNKICNLSRGPKHLHLIVIVNKLGEKIVHTQVPFCIHERAFSSILFSTQCLYIATAILIYYVLHR